MTYRNDIDGLRAISVFAILFGQKVKPQLEKIFNETNYTRS